MGTFKRCQYVMAACLFVVMGCEDALDIIDEIVDCHHPVDDTDDVDTEGTVDYSRCEVAFTCAGLESPEDCLADFGLLTNQAGNGVDGSYESYIGFFSYNDYSDGEMLPVPSSDDVGPSALIPSCDPGLDSAMHFYAQGYTTWGAGVFVNFGGSHNESCDVEGALDCLDIRYENFNFSLEDAAADPRCQGCEADQKLECLKLGFTTLEPKDLSDYVGVGFWVLATAENETSELQVNFPIPDTVRFYGECDMDDDVQSNDCYNDFVAAVPLSPSDVNQWVFKEVFFDELAYSPYWGLQLDTLGIDSFPPEQAQGLKFQTVNISGAALDVYIDDIILLRD